MSRYKKIALLTGGVIIIVIGLFLIMRNLSNPKQTRTPLDSSPTQEEVQVGTPSINIDFEEIEKRDPELVTEEEAQAVQSESDREFAEWQEEIYESYPWYSNLPLQTSEYFVYLDLEKKSFIGVLYQNEIPSDQVEAVKADIIEQLRSLGIDQALLDDIIWETE